MQKTYMYNVEVKFKNQEENVIMGIEGSSEEDVYNFIPCVIPNDVEYELIDIRLDDTTTVELERKKQDRQNELQAKYQEKYNEFVQICENMNDVQKKQGMAIVYDKRNQDFILCTLDQAKRVESEDMIIQIAAEPKTEEEIAKEKALAEADERVNKGEATEEDIELYTDYVEEIIKELDDMETGEKQ